MGKEIKKCTIISGAPDYSVDFLISNIDCNSFIIAADSGYKKLLSANIKPDMIIDIKKGIEDYMHKYNISSLDEIIGKVVPN